MCRSILRGRFAPFLAFDGGYGGLVDGMTNHVEAQLQDESLNWRTMAVTINGSQQIRARMDEVKRQFPDSRVRAVDARGRLEGFVLVARRWFSFSFY